LDFLAISFKRLKSLLANKKRYKNIVAASSNHQSLKKNNNKRGGTNQANYSINIPFKLELALGRHKIYVFY